ncbi:MAG: hypothetical protein E5X68_21940 [Mesorhizobium sp.]|nr:MAG: hypothetical protein EOQ84_26465 [Mesorhizobium sp.]RWL23928.1 MAG: hypothetical protein EOR58_24940 [Mesorhizobium sp.]RWL27090.1 MAG: hypothetical protein EOR63_24085 [Mesorhizobium sp.]RWL35377.1 MAG: hypothetical protein EOR59_22605 [Mesorhizobium sp.]RWL50622.1 MAG: hypothetical protein EOR61_23260 [Mesorhizobium sp.]
MDNDRNLAKPPSAATRAKRYDKHEATTESARSIIEGEAADRAAKTARLRAARLSQTPAGRPREAAAEKPRAAAKTSGKDRSRASAANR